MIDIRAYFKKWLIQQGYQVKTPSNHSSTVTEYLRRMDRICDRHYSRSDLQAWHKLAKNISSLIISYHECMNEEYFINKQNIEFILEHFKNLSNSNIRLIKLPAKLSLIIGKTNQFMTTTTFKEIENYITVFKGLLNVAGDKTKISEIDDIITAYKLTLEYSESTQQVLLYRKAIKKLSKSCDSSVESLILHIEYPNVYSKKDILALGKFYTFLTNPPANDNNSDSLFFTKLKDGRDDYKIQNCLSTIEETNNNFIKCINRFDKTGKNALQIKAHPQMDGHLTIKEVYSVLEVDIKTLRKLKKDGILLPTVGLSYDENVINKYLNDHFHRAQPPYPEVDYSLKNAKWINKRDAAEKLQVSERTIYNRSKQGRLTYTDYAPKAPRYYEPEIEFLAKK